jgi:hypothetical protein
MHFPDSPKSFPCRKPAILQEANSSTQLTECNPLLLNSTPSRIIVSLYGKEAFSPLPTNPQLKIRHLDRATRGSVFEPESFDKEGNKGISAALNGMGVTQIKHDSVSVDMSFDTAVATRR